MLRLSHSFESEDDHQNQTHLKHLRHIDAMQEKTAESSAVDKQDGQVVFRVNIDTVTDPVPAYSRREEDQLRRKIDLRLLPLMAITYGLQYVDKQTLTFASFSGLIKDTHLHGSQYPFLATIFYIGLLVGEYPANICLQKLPVAKFTSILVSLWGLTLACMAACDRFSTLALTRFFLGLFEAVVSPSMMLITASWYRRSEQPLRTGLWYGGQNFIGSIFALIGCWIQSWKGPLHTWQSLFLLPGGLTAGWGLVLFCFLPDGIATTSWLSQREKDIAFQRLNEEKTGVGNKQWKWTQVREAATDPQVYLMILYSFCANLSAAIGAFAGLLIQGLGFGPQKVALFNAPPGAFALTSILIFSTLTTKVKNTRCISMIAASILSSVGVVMVLCSDPVKHPYTQLAGVWVSAMSVGGFTSSIALATSNITGQTKRVVTNASIFVAFAVGSMIGPQFYFEREAPHYRTGLSSALVANVSSMIVAGILATYLHFQNKKRDVEAVNNPAASANHNEDEALMDKTDVQNRSFRYVI